MADLDSDVLTLLDRAAAGDVTDPDIEALIRRGAARRQRRQFTQVGAVMAAVATVIVGVVAIPGGSKPAAEHRPSPRPGAVAGPSAKQIARGTWVNIPSAPVKLCSGASATWDGQELIVVSARAGSSCHGAALYRPGTNSWRAIAVPPSSLHGSLSTAWSAGRLVVLNQNTGQVASWTRDVNRWDRLPPLRLSSSGGLPTLLAANGPVVVAVGDRLPTVERLAGSRWLDLPPLPKPPPGRRVQSETVFGMAAGFLDGRLYVVENASWWWKARLGTSGTERNRLVMLAGGKWQFVNRPKMALSEPWTMAPVSGGFGLTGSNCPPFAACPFAVGGAGALVRLGEDKPVFIGEPPGAPAGLASYNILFADTAFVDIYTSNGRNTGASTAPKIRAGDISVYDIDHHTWLRGQRMPAPVNRLVAQAWTPEGLVVLGQPSEKCVCSLGGLLLRPAD